MIARRRLAAGAVMLILCGQYLVAEAMAAAAWTTPYSYSRNYISDLGVTTCITHGPCSPWGAVMNTGLLLSGALAVAAAGLLAPLMRPGWRRLILGLALVHGIGSAVVGVIHSAPGTPAGTPRLHLIGAYLAIIGGNCAVIAAGLGIARAWSATAFRGFSIGLGLIGLASGLSLVVTRGWPPGLLERGAVDTITVWEVAAGLLLAARLKASRAMTAAPS